MHAMLLLEWALDPRSSLWVVPGYGLASSPRGWRVCNAPSSQEATLCTLKGYGERSGRIPSQVREGSYSQFYPNNT